MTAGPGSTGGFPARDALRIGRRMILLAALSQSVATGFMFGSFGAFVVPIEERMGVDRSLSAAGASLVILAIGLIAPFLGAAMRRFGLRPLLLIGALLCAAGYAGAAVSTTILPLLLCYGLLVGPGVALLGLAVPTALVANWFVAGRGRAIGIVNMPVAVAIVPTIIAQLLPRIGLDGTYLVLAGCTLLLVPALFLVVDHPERRGLKAHGHDDAAPEQGGGLPVPAAALVRTGDYWRVALAAAIIAGGGATLATHILPFAIGEGVDPALAAVLLALLGGAGVFGSLAYGMLSDRLGGQRALALNATIQSVLWFSFLMPLPFALRALLVVLIGLNAGGMIASVGTALSQRFGAVALGGALGLWSFISLPFTVGMPPLAGLLFERLGGYEAAFMVQIGLFIVAALLAGLSLGRKRRLATSKA